MNEADPRPSKRGRRAGDSGAREQILAAARELFAEHGFEGTTLRAVAKRAGVDGALPSYHFGSKGDLFAATLELPVSPREALAGVLAEAEHDEIATKLLTTLVGVWDVVGGGPLAALLRSATSQDQLLHGFVTSEILPLLRTAMDGEDVDLRAAAAASLVMGLVMARYVLRIEPLASAPPAEVVATVAPSLQRYFG
ncbi:TetR/AcrR family transcriptional regulator [Baekduia sp. Peel2402]|uniref:TetR/AcrR family transcriptional regulator n=1 Tax=Baekduia sp. Peel2402 TaxID=3458296 RepID=UPI00403EDD1F